MTLRNTKLTDQPDQSARTFPLGGFHETALVALPPEARGAFQELGQGLLATCLLLCRELGRTAPPREVLAALARDLDALAAFVDEARSEGDAESLKTARRTARSLARISRQLRSDLAQNQSTS